MAVFSITLGLCPINTEILINHAITTKEEEAAAEEKRLVYLKWYQLHYRVYGPNRRELLFCVGINEDRVHHLQFTHQMTGRIYQKLASGPIHFQSCFSFTAYILLIKGTGRTYSYHDIISGPSWVVGIFQEARLASNNLHTHDKSHKQIPAVPN